jgi:AcrR family transcriptional regulator
MAQDDSFQKHLVTARQGQILQAAAKVFAEKGFSHATIRDVAQAAGIADGTIYNYFKNKDALLLGILDQLNETPERAAQFAEAASLGLEQWTHQYFQKRYAAFSGEGRRVFQVVLAEALGNRELRAAYAGQVAQPTYAVAEAFFRQWMAEGALRPLDPAVTTRLVSAMFLGVLVLQLIGDPVLDTHEAELPGLMADLILHGLKKTEDERPD